MLVPRVTQDADPLQRRSHLRTGFVLFRGEPVGERSIRIAQPEALDELGIPQPTPFQILQCLRARLQGRVVKVDHLIE